MGAQGEASTPTGGKGVAPSTGPPSSHRLRAEPCELRRRNLTRCIPQAAVPGSLTAHPVGDVHSTIPDVLDVVDRNGAAGITRLSRISSRDVKIDGVDRSYGLAEDLPQRLER